MITRRSIYCYLMLTALMVVFLAVTGCGEKSQTEEDAVPSFCPTKYAAGLPSPQATANTPPRAFYQRVSTVRDQPLDIVLYACDPDDPTARAGLTWRADLGPCEGPCNGTIPSSTGAYPADSVITYTPHTGYVGTDSIQYLVDDGQAEGNIARIEITVNPPRATATSLYFAGRDDAGILNLWSYNTGSGLMTVPNSASILVTRGTYYFMDQTVFNGDLYLMGDLGDGGAALYAYNASGGFTTRSSGWPSYGSNFAVLGSTLYMGLSNIGQDNGYLWATDGVSPIHTVAGTADVYIENLAAYGGSLFFDGDDTVSRQLWFRSGSGTVGTLSSISAGVSFPYGLDPDSFTVFNNDLYFAGNTAPTGRTLWRLNGSGPITTVGNLQMSYMYDTPRMAVFDSVLCINAFAGTAPTQLWGYHPTNGLGVITNNSLYDVDPRYMVNFEGQLVFSGTDDTGQNHIMYTDGNSVGIVPGTAGMNPERLTVYDGNLFFGAGSYPDLQLWYTNSTLSSPAQLSFISTANGPGLEPSGLIVY